MLLRASAGITYYVRAQASWSGGGILHLNATLIVPPPNDDFAAATQIASLPFTDSIDMTVATDQVGEPRPACAGGVSGQSAWYVYDAPSSGSVSLAFGAYGAAAGIYRGTSLASLVSVGCANWYNTLTTVHLDAGSRYYFQVASSFQAIGISSLQVIVAPAPSAQFGYYPGDPSSFDTIQFQGSQYDPGNVGISSWAWTFGDGSTATTNYPQHRYAADGDYTVGVTVGTPDGRTASESRVVLVRTHDVAITKFTVPTSASAGQTRSITVGISDRRYPEQVSVTLFKLAPTGSSVVGTSNQLVPVRSGNRTTDFSFSYTFTSDDAQNGKVSFQAFAAMPSARDAIPGDNLAQSLPTKVTR